MNTWLLFLFSISSSAPSALWMQFYRYFPWNEICNSSYGFFVVAALNVVTLHNSLTLRTCTNGTSVLHIKMWGHLNGCLQFAICLWIGLKDRKYQTNIRVHFAWYKTVAVCRLDGSLFGIAYINNFGRKKPHKQIDVFTHIHNTSAVVVYIASSEFSLSGEFIVRLIADAIFWWECLHR